MTRFRLVTIVNPAEGREQEMNDWYDNYHVPDLLSVPGVASGTRLRSAHAPVAGKFAGQYMASFDLETSEPLSILAEIRRRTEAGEFSRSDAYELVSMAIYEVI